MTRNIKVVVIIATLLALAVGTVTWAVLQQGGTDPVLAVPDDMPVTAFEIPLEDYENRLVENEITLPPGYLIVSKLRTEYVSGEMRIVIPRLDLDATVGGDTTQPTLAEGPGLYKYSQIPNLYNTNVSIAGHRDLPPYPFYYLDTVGEGDNIYLVYKDKVFRYLYRHTQVVEPNDWNPIRVFYDSRVTLTTCTPLGTSKQRMIVVGELLEVEDYTEGYAFD